MEFATINGMTLHFSGEGAESDPPLVFINSLGTDLRIWDAVVPYFRDRYRLIRYDKRGHGMSDCPPAPYSIGDHAADLAGLLDFLKIDRATLIGISVGGMIAQDFAAKWPERIEKLLLADTGAKIGTAVMWNNRINSLRQQGMDALAESILDRWFAPSYPNQFPAAYRGYHNMLTRTPLDGYSGTCEAIRDADLTAATHTIQAPTLVLCGAEDSATPPELAKELAQLIPNAIFKEIPSAGHLPCIEQPEETAVQIKQFL